LPIGPDFGATSAAHRAGIAAFNISPLQLPLSPMCVFARGIKHPLDVSVQRGADSWPVTLSASNRGSSSNDQASISTSQAISGAFGRRAVSGCRRQPRHVRVRRQAGCSVPFRRRMVGRPRPPEIPPRWPPSSPQGAIWRSHRRGTAIPGALLRGGIPAGVIY